MRFKLFRQLEGMDCAPACIQMIAQHYGKNISLYLLRDLCNVTRLGVSGDDVISGCKAIGFETISCMVEKVKLSKLPLPAIIHWRQNHFVVLYDIKTKSSKRFYYIADPQYGKIALQEDVFYNEWCGREDKGYIVLMQPTDAFESIASEKNIFLEVLLFFLISIE